MLVLLGWRRSVVVLGLKSRIFWFLFFLAKRSVMTNLMNTCNLMILRVSDTAITKLDE